MARISNNSCFLERSVFPTCKNQRVDSFNCKFLPGVFCEKVKGNNGHIHDPTHSKVFRFFPSPCSQQHRHIYDNSGHGILQHKIIKQKQIHRISTSYPFLSLPRRDTQNIYPLNKTNDTETYS